MGVQRTKFHSAIQSPPQQHNYVTAIIEPTLGLNLAQPLTDLRPGETPEAQNYIIEDGYLTPRSGLSVWDNNVPAGGDPIALGYIAAKSNLGVETAVILWGNDDASTISTTNDNEGNPDPWKDVTQEISLSINTGKYWSMAAFQESSNTGLIVPTVIACHEDSYPIKMGFDGSNSITTLSTATATNDFFKYVAAFDDRCVLFNSADTFADSATAGFNPVRAQWSARGAPTDFANGGFENLSGMQGVGTGLAAERDRLVLLSSKDVWVGRPRRDAFAFDFFNVAQAKGCPQDYDRSIQATPDGTIWLGEGFQFYRLIGDQVRPLGDRVRSLLKSEMREWNHCFSVYNPADSIYGFFYSHTTGEYPTRALYLRTDTIQAVDRSRDDGVWMKQDFGAALASSPEIDGLTVGGVFNGELVASGHTLYVYRSHSTQTTDNGTAIDCRWRSHALSNDRNHTNHLAITEAWLDVEESTSTATTGLHYTVDRADSFTDAGDFVTSNETPFSFLPLTSPAARQPQFELRIDDGSQPKIGRIQLTLREYTGRHRG